MPIFENNNSSENNATVSLCGEVQNVTFFNEETNYLIAKIKSEEDGGIVTVVGNVAKVSPGEILELTGAWTEHPKYGRQFQVDTFKQSLPAGLNGVRRYLASGAVYGIGPVLSERLITAFGKHVLEVLDSEPERLLEISGFSKRKLAKILASWKEKREIRSLMLFLETHEVSTTFAGKIFNIYGAQAIDKLKNDPYDLAYNIRGVGFRTADAMALRLGFSYNSPQRLEAALVYTLLSNAERGDMYMPKENLLVKTSDILAGEVGWEQLENALESLEDKKKAVIEILPEGEVREAVYLRGMWGCEREIAKRLNALANHPHAEAGEKLDIRAIEEASGLKLSEEQRQAALGALKNKLFVITGGPGTGKTTITKIVVRGLQSLGLSIKLAAPTGRAAKRLGEATNFPASTLHRLLQYRADGDFGLNETDKLKADAVIVDEASMLDARLCLHLLRALPMAARLVLVGDVNQLPPVGPGNILQDILASDAISAAELQHIFRQAAESMIIVNSHRINQGLFPLPAKKRPPEADFFWVEQDDPVVVSQRIVDYVCTRIPKTYGLRPDRDIQVLSPMHKGEVGTLRLNTELRERINPPRRGLNEITKGRTTFRVGDRVLMTRNDYEKEVFNGDLGWVLDIDLESGELLAEFDGRGVIFEPKDLDELSLAYAITVHKSQGSEYPAVVIPLVTQHYMLLRRNLIYTALSRAKKLAVLIGSRKAMTIGLSSTGMEKRYTHLRYRLQRIFNAKDSQYISINE